MKEFILIATTGNPVAAQEIPNFVFIVVDGLGWDDVGFNNPEMKDITPNIDRLASQGMKFTNAYAAPVCSPTRAALLTIW